MICLAVCLIFGGGFQYRYHQRVGSNFIECRHCYKLVENVLIVSPPIDICWSFVIHCFEKVDASVREVSTNSN